MTTPELIRQLNQIKREFLSDIKIIPTPGYWKSLSAYQHDRRAKAKVITAAIRLLSAPPRRKL